MLMPSKHQIAVALQAHVDIWSAPAEALEAKLIDLVAQTAQPPGRLSGVAHEY